MTDKKERLKRVYALAMNGVDGERVQAQAILEKLLKKYAMTLDDLDEDIINEYEIEYHGKEQEKLLMQTIYKVTDNKNSFYHLRYTYSGRKCKTRLGVCCTAVQKAEIEFLFTFYIRVWEKERKALLEAFIQKHSIFGNLKGDEKPQKCSPEELEKMYALMSGLSDETPLLQIEGNTAI